MLTPSSESWDKHVSRTTDSVHAQDSWTKRNAKVILVTGSASGFGKETAKKLLAKGHIVYGADIDKANNHYLSALGGTPLSMDVRKERQVHSGVNRILKEQGRIDVLINNAGYGEFSTIENISIDDLKNQFDVNLFGYARLQQAVLPIMRKQRSGRVIIVSSVIGKFSMPVLGWYAATKHATEAMADALRQEVSQFHIDVVKIQPGAVNTNFAKTAYKQLDQAYIPEDYKLMASGFRAGLDSTFAKAGGPEETASVILTAVEVETPRTTYVTTDNGKAMAKARQSMSEDDFYKMLSN